MYCAFCGTAATDEGWFCPVCGKRVAAAPPAGRSKTAANKRRNSASGGLSTLLRRADALRDGVNDKQKPEAQAIARSITLLLKSKGQDIEAPILEKVAQMHLLHTFYDLQYNENAGEWMESPYATTTDFTYDSSKLAQHLLARRRGGFTDQVRLSLSFRVGISGWIRRRRALQEIEPVLAKYNLQKTGLGKEHPGIEVTKYDFIVPYESPENLETRIEEFISSIGRDMGQIYRRRYEADHVRLASVYISLTEAATGLTWGPGCTSMHDLYTKYAHESK